MLHASGDTTSVTNVELNAEPRDSYFETTGDWIFLADSVKDDVDGRLQPYRTILQTTISKGTYIYLNYYFFFLP